MRLYRRFNRRLEIPSSACGSLLYLVNIPYSDDLAVVGNPYRDSATSCVGERYHLLLHITSRLREFLFELNRLTLTILQ